MHTIFGMHARITLPCCLVVPLSPPNSYHHHTNTNTNTTNTTNTKTGISQAWMLSSGLPPDVTARGQALYWFGLKGLQTVTALDLGGSHFTHAVWVGHMCPLLGSLSSLQRLMLAHCSVPTGKLQYLLPLLSTSLVDLNIDR